MIRRSAIERLFDKIHPEPNSGCWLWIGGVSSSGYGSFALDGKNNVLAHRASWSLRNGYMPTPDVKLCHKCDVMICVNPDHLFMGTQKDNMRDAANKGRMGKADVIGSKNPQTHLSETDVISIRSDTRVARLIAADYKICSSTVYMIKNRRNWGWL